MESSVQEYVKRIQKGYSCMYEKFVNDYGPDDHFSLKKLIEKHY
jgi:hypothetical protein